MKYDYFTLINSGISSASRAPHLITLHNQRGISSSGAVFVALENELGQGLTYNWRRPGPTPVRGDFVEPSGGLLVISSNGKPAHDINGSGIPNYGTCPTITGSDPHICSNFIVTHLEKHPRLDDFTLSD